MLGKRWADGSFASALVEEADQALAQPGKHHLATVFYPKRALALLLAGQEEHLAVKQSEQRFLYSEEWFLSRLAVARSR